MMKNAVILVRASSAKQAAEGDSLTQQREQCQSYIKKQGWNCVKVFSFIESGAADVRTFFNEVIDYSIDPKNKVDVLVFKNMSRFTRAGGAEYLALKKKLDKSGIRLTDIFHTLSEEVNTLEDLGLSYSWSCYFQNDVAEIEMAEQARSERRNILSQMLRAEVTYVRLGYYVRSPPYGYVTKKIETEHGKRAILIPVPEEAFYIKKVFELRAQGFNQKEIANQINSLGYRSRIRNKRDSRTQKAVSTTVGTKANDKRISEMLARPVYAGVIREVWTNMQPVKARFPGIIDLDLFNRANQGKINISIAGEKVSIKYDKELSADSKKQRRSKNNPLYPFKNVVLCPKCGRKLAGSASKGRSGKRYPAYHCSAGHARWALSSNEVNENISDFIGKLEFDVGFSDLLKALFYEEWDKKRQDVIEESHLKEKIVDDLLAAQKNVFNSIKSVGSSLVRKALESEYDELEVKLIAARETRDLQVRKEINVKKGFEYAKYFMEHWKDLLIDRENVRRQEQLFGMLFDELPTYDQIVNGTAKLNLYFSVNKNKDLSLIRTGDPDRDRTGDLFRDREAC